MPTQDDAAVEFTYRLAPDPPVGVSSAAACTATLTDEKRQAVKGYLTDLGPALRNRYGRQPNYTPEQVRESALSRGLNIDYLCWAFVLYLTSPDFERIHSSAGEVCDYGVMRETIGTAFFGGNADFVTADFTDALVSGATDVASGGALGWLIDIDWGSLLDWS